ncbi:seipin-like isoform X2 [Hypomesus transpacificus]|uniref:seipin-like isoform X2 n=1 Tax=Hypomesus transpacificus TaxID=137520 RepID=UPI001F0755B7|nr:seipin-like isoform X2 [Hypomesus transpacificus]XP_046903917.1 seipin-like isoform X2 [Hypomesus transpacificus]
MDQEDNLMDGEGHQETGNPVIGETEDPIGLALLWLHDRVAMAMLQTRQRVLQAGVMLIFVTLLLWISSFLYGTFYYSYMPLATYSTPVHYFHRVGCESSTSVCSFPIANVSLLRHGKHQVMTYGLPYRICLELQMPESPANQELGMFMVSMNCYSRGGQTVSSSIRSTMLHYRSGLLRSLGTLLFLPAYLSGAAEQRQLVEVELYSDYVDNSCFPSIGAVIEIHSHRVQIYSAHLYIHAHYTGIRYLLFNFPLVSAFVGVASNFAFLSIILLSGYLRMFWGQLWTPKQAGFWAHLQQGSPGLQSQRRLSEKTDHSEDDQDNIAEISADPQTYEEPQIESSLKREDQSSLHTAGGGMEVKHRRIQSDTLVETILEGGAMSRGMSTDSDLEGVPDSTPATHIGSCVIS